MTTIAGHRFRRNGEFNAMSLISPDIFGIIVESEGASNTIGLLSNQALRMLNMDTNIIPTNGDVVTRKDAQRLGLRNYFLGTPCKNGHIAERRTGDCHCVECHRLNEIERRNIPERRAARLLQQKTYTAANIEAVRLKIKEWRLKNKERLSAVCRKWRENNPEKCRLHRIRATHVRRMRKNVGGDRYKNSDVARLFAAQKARCAECRTSIKKRYDIDHIMPLALGGDNSPRNIQLLCSPCNRRKYARHPIQWAQENGRLL